MKPLEKNNALALIQEMREEICAALPVDYSFSDLAEKVSKGVSRVFYWEAKRSIVVFEQLGDDVLSLDLIYCATPNVIGRCFDMMYLYAKIFNAKRVICKPATSSHCRLYKSLGFKQIDDEYLQVIIK